MRVLRFLIYSFPIMSINYSVSHRNRIDICIYKVYTHCVCFRCSMKIYLELTNKTPQNITIFKSYLLYFFYIASCLKKSLRNFEGKNIFAFKRNKKNC